MNDDKVTWKAYWKALGQPWRTEPEIDTERKKYLAERRNITPDIKKGIYPCFYSEPGVDLLLVTPLNRTVSPIDPACSKLFQSVFNGCLNQEHSPRLSNRRMASRQCSRRL